MRIYNGYEFLCFISYSVTYYISINGQQMEIDKDKLKEKIQEGKSSHDVAMTLGCHPSTVRRKANAKNNK